MHRRYFLATVAATAGLTSLAGCSATDLPGSSEDLLGEEPTPESTDLESTTTAATPDDASTAPVRLTRYEGDSTRPSWSPDGRMLVYQRRKTGSGRAADIGRVDVDGTSEEVWITGPSAGFGIAGGPLHWLDSTRLLTYEAVRVHEIMAVDTSSAPFERAVSDGDDEMFTRKLLVPGGGGALTHSLSADGSTLVWASRDSSGTYTVRAASFESLSGQSSGEHGTVLLGPSETRLERGLAVVFDGSGVVISRPSGEGFDLFLHDTETGEEVAQLTTSGESAGRWNIGPAISLDAELVAYMSASSNQEPFQLTTMGLFGTEPSKVLTDPEEINVANPAWSPGGSQIAFQGRPTDDPDSSWALYRIGSRAGGVSTATQTETRQSASRREGPWISALDAARLVEEKMIGDFEAYAVTGHVAMGAGDPDAGHYEGDEPSPAGGLALVWAVTAESDGQTWNCSTDFDSTNCQQAHGDRPTDAPNVVGLGIDSLDAYDHWLEDESFASFTESPDNSLLMSVEGTTWKAVVTDHESGGGGSWTWDPVEGIDEGSTH